MTCLYYNSNLNEYSTERFRRPSKCQPVANPYVFQDFVKDYDAPPFINKVFKNSKEVILAYFGILANASNMPGFLGGAGQLVIHFCLILMPMNCLHQICRHKCP